MNDNSSLVCKEIIAGKLPDAAVEWDVIEEIHTLKIRGGGESASWDSYVLIRQNGKQIWRNTLNKFNYEKPLNTLFADRLVKVCKLRKGILYVLKPA